MIALYCQTEPLLEVISRSALPTAELQRCENWQQLQRARRRAQCSILVIESLAADPVFRRQAESRHERAAHPTILVTTKDPENLRLIRNVPLQEILWFEEAAHALGPAIQRVKSAAPLDLLADSIAASDQLPQRLRHALQYACHRATPVRSVAHLAAETGCHRATLSRLWKRSIGADAEHRLEDFLDWLIVLRALARRAVGQKWSAVAHDLEVPERTLRRLTRKWVPKDLRAGGGTDPLPTATSLEEWIHTASRHD